MAEPVAWPKVVRRRHRCRLQHSPQCLGWTSGTPRRAKCPSCGGAIDVESGWYALVRHQKGGRYDYARDIISVHGTHAAATAAPHEGLTLHEVAIHWINERERGDIDARREAA